MNQRVDLKETMSRVLKKGWLILLLIAALAAAARFVSANYIQKIYKASATMFIGTEQQGTVSNLTLSEIEASNRLIVDYKEIANSRRVIDPVTEELDLEMDLLDFRKALELEIIANSRLFTVSFSSPDPELAADVANSVSQQLLTSISDIVNVQNVRVIDSAQVPTLPDSPDVNMITILAAVLGLIVGLLVVYFNSVFNDTYSSQEAIENELQLDVVAVIPRFREEKSSYSKGLAAITEPNSMLSESFKMLRTNISYMNKEGLNKVIMLTSSVASEGKTTTSCNLAVTIAQDHKKVLLIDGDLRKPNLFKMFKIMMMPGLTDIIYGKYTLPEAIQRSVDVPGPRHSHGGPADLHHNGAARLRVLPEDHRRGQGEIRLYYHRRAAHYQCPRHDHHLPAGRQGALHRGDGRDPQGAGQGGEERPGQGQRQDDGHGAHEYEDKSAQLLLRGGGRQEAAQIAAADH